MGALAVAKIGTDFRVTIPKEIRELLELDEGDELLFFQTEGWIERVCLRKSYKR
jgi:AbrB family looped-hinge helix DNA binding protein